MAIIIDPKAEERKKLAKNRKRDPLNNVNPIDRLFLQAMDTKQFYGEGTCPHGKHSIEECAKLEHMRNKIMNDKLDSI